MKSRNTSPFCFPSTITTIFTVALFTHFAAPSAFAQALYWDNDPGPGFGTAGGTWSSTASLWTTDAGGAGAAPGTTISTTSDTVNFGTSAVALAAGTITVSGPVDANRLVFAASTSGPFTLSGGTISLGGTSPSITNNRGGQIIGSAITLNANTSIATAVSGTAITLNGAIGGTANLTFTTANVDLGGSNTFFFLGAASNYAGTTTITTGRSSNSLTVRPTVSNALPTTTVLALTGGAGAGSGRQVAYDLNNFDQTIAGLTNTAANLRTQRILTNTGTSKLTINNTSPASSTFSGNLNGTGLSLAKTGTGTQILSSTNSLTGNTIISGGKLQGVVGGNCASSKVVIDNTLGTFGISVTDNTKTWTCAGLAPTAAGEIEFSFGAVIPSTTVSPLTITVPTVLTGLADFTAATPKIRVNTAAGLAPGTYPLMTWDTVSGTVPSTADLIPPTLLSQTAASLAVSGNTLNLVITSTAVGVVKANNTNNLNVGTSWVGGVVPDATKTAVWDNTVTAANTTLLGADATWGGISIVNPGGPVTISAGNTLTLGAAAFDIDMSAATADLTLNCALTMGDASIWEVPASRTLTLGGPVSAPFGVTKQGAGTLQLGTSNILPDGVGNGNLALTGTLDLKGNSDTINGLSGAGIIDNTLAATSPTLTVGANDQTSTFGGIIKNTSGTLNLVKTGTGSLVLGGANTLSGSVTVNDGTLAFSNTAPLNNASGITLAGGTALRPDVVSAVVVPPITVGATGTTAIITAPTVVGAGGSNPVPVTISSAISGDGNVTFRGIQATNAYGRINLNAPCNYAGSTLLTTLSGFGGGALNNANIFVVLGAENTLPVTTVLTLDGGNGTGGGRFCELNLNGNNQTLAGLTNVTGRTLRSQEISNTSTTACTLTVNNTLPFTYAALIGGGASGNNLGLTKSGAGTFTIAGANTYAGATTISGGTLALGALNTLPNASAVSIGAGTLSAATVGTETAGTLDITGAASITLAGGAQLVFADSSGGGSATWAGNLSIGGFVSGSSLNFGSSTGLTAQQLSKISAPGFTGFALDAEGDLTATSTGGFSSWISGTFTNGTIPLGQQGPNADFDNDGISNLVEYALANQDPTVPNASVGSFAANVLSFTKRPDASGLTYAIQESTDLGSSDDWTEVTGGSYVNNATTISYTLTPGTPVKNFTRLKVLSN